LPLCARRRGDATLIGAVGLVSAAVPLEKNRPANRFGFGRASSTTQMLTPRKNKSRPTN